MADSEAPWLEVGIPLRGKVVLIFEHAPEMQIKIADVEYTVPVKFTANHAVGIPTVEFSQEVRPR